MSNVERIEEHRELVAGLEHEDWTDRVTAEDDDESGASLLPPASGDAVQADAPEAPEAA